MPDYDASYPKEGEGKSTDKPSGISKSMAPVSTEGMGRAAKLLMGAAKVYKQGYEDFQDMYVRKRGLQYKDNE